MDRKDIADGWTEEADLDELESSPFRGITQRRALLVLGVLGLLVLMAVVPPLINVGRYRRQIATSIGASLGRPVRIDSVSLNVLPVPGFTLENFVVDEDPAFGAEPVIRAQEVRATLRISSLWRRRVEFSRISLDDPSVNLVHLPNGQWNLESILLQASRMPAAPTEQKGAGDAPRFPYIEATGARVNVKMGLEKMPLSLTDAEFALWLPEPKQWRLRLKANPSRTDAAATDSGTLRAEGTLGQAETLGNVPVNLTGEWSAAPLGAVSRVLMGSDAGLRGQMTLTAGVKGTVGENEVRARLELRELRRADFVPARTLDADVSCTAKSAELFHALSRLHCALPADAAADAQAGGMVVTGELPDVFHPGSAQLQAAVTGVSGGTLLDLLRIMSSSIAPELDAGGTLTARAACCGVTAPAGLATAGLPKKGVALPAKGVAQPAQGPVTGEFELARARLAMGAGTAFVSGDVTGAMVGSQLVVGPFALALGGREPAMLVVTVDKTGYAMRLTGTVLRSRLNALVRALPPLGEGLETVLPPVVPAEQDTSPGTTPTAGATAAVETPIRIDVTARRLWGGGQSWGQATVVKTPGRRGSKRR